MKKTGRRAAVGAELTLLLTLNLDSQALGAADGFQWAADKGKKHSQLRDAPFSLFLSDDGCGGSVCRITVPRPCREWETLSRMDYYPLTDALTRRFVLSAEQHTGLPLSAHISELRVVTPPEAAVRGKSSDGSLSDVYRKLFPEKQEMRVTAVRTKNGFTQIDLRKTDGFSAAPFRAGQSVRLTLPTDANAGLSLPLCCAPSCAAQGIYTAAATAGSGIAAELHEGDSVSVSSPFGSLSFRPVGDHETIVGMTDGKCLPSFLSMAKAILEGADQHKLTVLYCGETDGCSFEQEYEGIGKNSARVRFIRFPPGNNMPNEAFFRSVLPHESYTVYLAGDDAARDKIRKYIAPLHLAVNNIREFPSVY